MKILYENLVNYVASQYNTLVASTVLVPGKNVFANNLPDAPPVAVAIFSNGAQKDPHSLVSRPEFDLVVRSSRGSEGDAAQMFTRIYGILNGAVNIGAGTPGLVRAVEEIGGGGFDKQDRPLYVARFVFWGVIVT